MCPLVKELALYDVMNTAGVAADLSHIDSAARVTAFTGDRELGGALYGADLVIIPAGVPRKPGMTRDDLFKVNAGIVKKLCEAVTRFCPQAWVAVISNPVNSTVPIAAEVFKRAGCFNPARLFGVTTLDVVRANTFVAEVLNADPRKVEVPVVGGHAGKTILPLLSRARPRPSLSAEQLQALTLRIQNAGTEVVEAKAGAGSATLSMAYAAHRFAESCLKAMGGQVVEVCAFVANPRSGALPDVAFFAAPLQLGPSGLQKVDLPPSCLSHAEQMGLQSMLPELQASIDKGIRFATQTS